MNNRMLTIFGLMALGFSCQLSAADKVYKWQAEDGTVVFSDTPPPDTVVEELDLPQAPAPTTGSGNRYQQQLMRQSEQISRRADQRRARRDALQRELDKTRDKIAQAREELEQGKEPKEGERQHLSGGGSRLSDDYFKRLERQENEIERLEQRASELLDELRALR